MTAKDLPLAEDRREGWTEPLRYGFGLHDVEVSCDMAAVDTDIQPSPRLNRQIALDFDTEIQS